MLILYAKSMYGSYKVLQKRKKEYGPLSSVFANNINAEQPVHLCSLVSALVIRLLENIITKLIF